MGRLDLIDDWIVLAREARYSSERLARICGVSGSQLRRYFHAVSGRSPQEWLNDVRLWDALELLCQGKLVKEVAAELHFADSAHLDHQFGNHHGGAPLECVRIFHERRRKALERGILDEDVILPWKEAERRLAAQLRSRRVRGIAVV